MDTKQFVGRSAAAGAIGMLCVVVAGIGVATAANGGSLLLGQSNTATHTTTLKDTTGAPLSLITKKNKSPLTVNSKTLVKNLNAGELGGLTSPQLSTGSNAEFKLNLSGTSARVVELPQPTGTIPNETFSPVSIVATAKLAAGIYEVNASAFGDNILCWLGTTSAMGSEDYSIGGTDATTVSESTALKVTKGQRVHEYCAGSLETSGDPGGAILTAGITAVKVGTSLKGSADTSTTSEPLIRTSARLLK